MKISEAKSLLSKIVVYNMEQAASKKGHDTFIVPMFIGDPGVGKTSIPKQVSKELEISYCQAIVAQYDAGEMAGLPVMNADMSGMVRLRPDYLPPYEADPKTGEDFTSGVFNLDELPQAFLANQNVVSQIVNEYRVGHHKIGKGWTMCCTGNKPENKAGTTTMPTHLRDRLMFISIDTDADEWLDYAAQVGMVPQVRSYIRQNKGKLHDFNPTNNANPTPRSWEKVSAIISMNLTRIQRAEAIAGQIGDGHATAFIGWLKVEDKMPRIEDIIAEPEKAPLFGNKDADVLYMLLASLADVADAKNIKNIMKYINRMPEQEFSMTFMSDAWKRNPELQTHPAVIDWKASTGIDLLLSTH